MVQSGQITFYTHQLSPYGHRVHMALEETGAKYKLFIVDIMNKPSWYAERVNPAGKVPAITYGGPEIDPEDPSAESVKIPESAIINEFLADLYPQARLLPLDPVKRAKARLLIALFEPKFYDAMKAVFFLGEPPTVLLDAFEAVQARLPPTGFMVGEFSVADIGLVPFFVRIIMLLKNDMGKYPVGEGKKAFEELEGPKFSRLMIYIGDVTARQSFQKTFDEESTLELWKMNPYIQRDQGSS